MIIYIQLYLSALLGSAGILAMVFGFFSFRVAMDETAKRIPRIVASVFMYAAIMWVLISFAQVYIIWSI